MAKKFKWVVRKIKPGQTEAGSSAKGLDKVKRELWNRGERMLTFVEFLEKQEK